jgi:glycosyltransferase involved in cell wall biosynthesis
MSATFPGQATLVRSERKPWILIAAYDLSTGDSSEGHVAFNIVSRLCKTHRIVLVTRRNNKARLEADPDFIKACREVHLVGYDLPQWTCWWKRGARFYQAYAYLWQMTWPLALDAHTRLLQVVCLVHVLNFHNDSIPSLAWRLGPPVIWGPINHNEAVAPWRRTFWPTGIGMRNVAAFALRRVLWRIDPFLRLHIRNSDVVLSAGEWVDRRLDLSAARKVIRRSQLGVSEEAFSVSTESAPSIPRTNRELICAGRLDWIKGVDLAIEALSLLPAKYCLRIVGRGPAESRLRALAAQLGLETRVTFQPPVPRSELSELYARSDLFLFPSAEVAGLVWVEALTSGLPVVAFDGATEVAAAAGHLPGIHIAAEGATRRAQVENLATAIRASVDLPRTPAELRAAVLKHYSWDELAATILEAYREMVEHSR